jgi:hypothetical protein
MLWYKTWLETRGRIVLALVMAVFPIVVFIFGAHSRAAHPPLAVLQSGSSVFGFYWVFIAVFLAGSGIKTQTFRAQRGLHASMFYTLSLPVSRLRFLGTRAATGFIELAAICVIGPFEMLLIFPPLRQSVMNSDLLKYWIVILACTAFCYAVSTLFSTFLDDLLQNWISLLGLGVLWVALSHSHIPARFDIFRALGADSPIFTHSLPWATMGISVACAAILFSAAAMVVRSREY